MATIKTSTSVNYIGDINVSNTNSVTLSVLEVDSQDKVPVSSVDTVLPLTSIVSPVYLMIENTDAAAVISLSLDTHVSYPVKISPHSAVTLEFNGITASQVYMKSTISGSFVAFIAC